MMATMEHATIYISFCRDKFYKVWTQVEGGMFHVVNNIVCLWGDRPRAPNIKGNPCSSTSTSYSIFVLSSRKGMGEGASTSASGAGSDSMSILARSGVNQVQSSDVSFRLKPPLFEYLRHPPPWPPSSTLKFRSMVRQHCTCVHALCARLSPLVSVPIRAGLRAGIRLNPASILELCTIPEVRPASIKAVIAGNATDIADGVTARKSFWRTPTLERKPVIGGVNSHASSAP